MILKKMNQARVELKLDHLSVKNATSCCFIENKFSGNGYYLKTVSSAQITLDPKSFVLPTIKLNNCCKLSKSII